MTVQPSLHLRELLVGQTRSVIHVSRFAGTPVQRRESVAEHSYMTAQYALFIGTHCLALGAAVDLGKLLARALVHDLDEAIMVDLPRPIKYADPALRERWHVLCVRAIAEMEKDLGVPFYEHWKDAKDNSLEGAILALADLISVTSYCIEEIQFGNKHMEKVLRANLAYLRQYYNRAGLASELRAMVRQAYEVAEMFIHAPGLHEVASVAAAR